MIRLLPQPPEPIFRIEEWRPVRGPNPMIPTQGDAMVRYSTRSERGRDRAEQRAALERSRLARWEIAAHVRVVPAP
jgi:hypothetical protein